MKMRRRSKYLAWVVILGLNSCSSEITYEIKIENKTNYQLDSLVVGPRDGSVLTIPPNDQSNSFKVSRRDNLASFFSEPLLGIWVKSYSDSSSSYSNNIGHVISFSDLDEGVITKIIVTKDTNSYYKSDIFHFMTTK